MGLGNLNWAYQEGRDWTESRSDMDARWDKRRKYDTLGSAYDFYGTFLPGAGPAPPLEGKLEPSKDTATPPAGRTVADTIDVGRDVTRDISKTFDKTVADLRTAVLGVDDFRLVLSALKQMDGVTVVSNPKIIVANEEPAKIHIGRTEKPFVAQVTPATQTTAPFTTYTPGDPVELGVKLTVTPTVNTMSNITVKITPELTRFLRYDVAPDGATKYPVVATKKIETVFCIESGRTVAIGGLTETRDQDVTKKIPLLGDIPLIGKYLFSHQHKEKTQQETLIFVTVGLALPENLQAKTGLPEDTDLAHRHMMKSAVERQKRQEDLERAQRALEKDLERRAAKARAGLK
jgi:type II secretory pathway component GspD/PulD (secretin)